MNLVTRTTSRMRSFIQTKPFASFFVLLGLLFVLLVIGRIASKPKAAPAQAQAAAKPVTTYKVNGESSLEVQAKVEKSGVISLIAQTSGIVQSVSVKDGMRVARGARIANLSTTYSGANAASLSRALAQKNRMFTEDNYQTQKDIIDKQRDMAVKGSTQADVLRDISKQSITDTQASINLSQDIISMLDAQITALQAVNGDGSKDGAILGAKQGKAAALSGLNALQNAQRNVIYQTDSKNEPAALSNLQKDTTLKQLDIQEKSLDLGKDVAILNEKLARLNESLMYPTSPATGSVEHVNIHVGQMVSPGMVIATIRADKGETVITASVPQQVAMSVNRMESAHLSVNGKDIALATLSVSREATDGTLHTIVWTAPATIQDSLTNNTFVSIKVPLHTAAAKTNEVSIPLDSVYQTEEKSFVYVVTTDDNGIKHATSKEVTVGTITGSFVTIQSGLTPQDEVIVTRSVQDGDAISIQ